MSIGICYHEEKQGVNEIMVSVCAKKLDNLGNRTVYGGKKGKGLKGDKEKGATDINLQPLDFIGAETRS